MRKRLALMLGGLAATVALVGGATFAFFSAQGNTQTNTFATGTLCLSADRDQGQPVPGPMFYINSTDAVANNGTLPTGLWAPGDSHTRVLNVTDGPTLDNPGCASTLNAWLDSVQATVQSGDASLAGDLNVTVLAPDPNTNYVPVASGTLAQFIAGPVNLRFTATGLPPDVAVNATEDLKFQVGFPLSAGNVDQGKSLVVQFTVNGVQQKNNPNPV